jgi:hypothetical protein
VPLEPAQIRQLAELGCGAAFFASRPDSYRELSGRVSQYFINGSEFKNIDLGIDYKSVLALATVSRETFEMLKHICLV